MINCMCVTKLLSNASIARCMKASALAVRTRSSKFVYAAVFLASSIMCRAEDTQPKPITVNEEASTADRLKGKGKCDDAWKVCGLGRCGPNFTR
jgi:hypothetical protein